jgi:hypothetical protein
MKRLLFLILVTLPFACLFAQPKQDNVIKPGNIEIVLDDSAIDSLLKASDVQAEKEYVIKGFRVQIIAAGNRADINKVKSQFYTVFPDIKTFVIYQQPNFKLRVGNYRTKMEAYKVWTEIEKHFPGSFITPDELKLNEL